MAHPHLSIAIVGVGPRGLCVLERICANARTLATGTRLTVHIVDPYPPGAGQVWRTRQSRHLLMNTVASQITIFPDDSVEMAGPVTAGPSLYEWAKEVVAPAGDGLPAGAADASSTEFPAEAHDEAAGLGPDTYPTRAFYGHYLEWVFHRVVVGAPSRVRIRLHRTRAIALDDGISGDLQRLLLDDGTTIEDLHAIVLAQGHVGVEPTRDERALTEFASAHRLRYVAPTNPADADLSWVRPGATVALRGLGLCFFDYMALLSEGRGGRYQTGADGQLVYQPSGREPRMVALSRRGVPHRARGENQKGPHGRHTPQVVTPDRVDELQMRSIRESGLDFRSDIWPLIAKEVETVYYTTLLAERGGDGGDGVDIDAFRRTYLDCAWASDRETEVLDRYGVTAPQRWDWPHVEHPYHGTTLGSVDEFRAWLLEYLRDDVREARGGNLSNPTKAALDVLRDLRNEVRLLVDHGGLHGASHERDLDGWYTPLNAHLSIGPPASRVAEAIALIEAGVLDILGPATRVRADPASGRFVVEGPYPDGPALQATGLIEARLPQPDIRVTVDPLLRYLLARGRAMPFRVTRRDGGVYETGGLAVIDRPYHIVDATGRVHPRRFAFGVPTEAVHWVTAAGIRPGVNSVTVADADAIARTILWLPEHTDTPVNARRTDSLEAAQ